MRSVKSKEIQTRCGFWCFRQLQFADSSSAAAIQAHVQKQGVQEIAGTYRRQPVKHYFDPTTKAEITEFVGEYERYLVEYRQDT